jgi:predicted ferric reductase
MPIFFGIIWVIILIILSALTTSELKWVHVINVVVSLLGVATFEILAFATSSSADIIIFIIRQGIALSFLLALYFSARSTLGMFSQTSEAVVAEPVSKTKKENEELLEEIKNRNDSRVEF